MILHALTLILTLPPTPPAFSRASPAESGYLCGHTPFLAFLLALILALTLFAIGSCLLQHNK